MANGDSAGKYPTWKWLVAIMIIALGFFISADRASVTAQIDKKLDIAVYRADREADRQESERLMKDLKDIKSKVDCIYNWHLPKELRDK